MRGNRGSIDSFFITLKNTACCTGAGRKFEFLERFEGLKLDTEYGKGVEREPGLLREILREERESRQIDGGFIRRVEAGGKRVVESLGRGKRVKGKKRKGRMKDSQEHMAQNLASFYWLVW